MWWIVFWRGLATSKKIRNSLGYSSIICEDYFQKQIIDTTIWRCLGNNGLKLHTATQQRHCYVLHCISTLSPIRFIDLWFSKIDSSKVNDSKIICQRKSTNRATLPSFKEGNLNESSSCVHVQPGHKQTERKVCDRKQEADVSRGLSQKLKRVSSIIA